MNPADCERCVAPCCNTILFANNVRDSLIAAEGVRPKWLAAGADLIPVYQGVYQCSAFAGGCTVYDARPLICRAYDCQTETGEWWMGGPRCDLPATRAERRRQARAKAEGRR